MLSSENLTALSLNGFCEAFGAIRKGVKEGNCGYIPKRWGYVQSYLKLDLVVVFHVRSRADDCHYHLVFHRVPSDARNYHPVSTAKDGWVSVTGNSWSDGEADCVLPIRELGDFSNCIVSPGVSVTSRVWLFPFNDLPKFGGDGAVFEGSVEVDGASAPREMQISFLGDPPNGTARGKHGLVKRVPKVAQCLGRPSGQGARNGIEYLELVDLITGFRIDIYDLSIRLSPFNDGAQRLGVKEISETNIKLVDCFPCPSDTFLRTIKCG